MNKKSITVTGHAGPKVKHVYLIKDIEVDEVVLEKYTVECRGDIQDAWEAAGGNNKTMEILLIEKVSNIKLPARPAILELASKNAGQIIKDFGIFRPKSGKKVYINALEFFVEKEKDA